MKDDVRKTAIDVMRQGGQELCEQARAKWYRGEYGNCPNMQKQQIAHWSEVENAVAKIASELRRKAAA